LKEGHRRLEVGHADGESVALAHLGVAVPVALDPLPDEVPHAARQVAGQAPVHPVLGAPALARREQRRERQELEAARVAEPNAAGEAGVEAAGRRAVGEEPGDAGHPQHDGRGPRGHDQRVALPGPEQEGRGGACEQRPEGGAAAQVGAEEVGLAVVGVHA
jgi:hypothetical protein